MRMKPTMLVLTGLLLGLAGCDRPTSPDGKQAGNSTSKTRSETSQPDMPPRNQDMSQILRGARIFQQNCATCHGKLAQGAPDWRQRNADGTFPAPPLNGDGHTWHHSMKVLKDTVRNGTIPLGGSMPAWGDKLSEQDIEDVLAWVKAQWPDDIYARWYLNNQRK